MKRYVKDELFLHLEGLLRPLGVALLFAHHQKSKDRVGAPKGQNHILQLVLFKRQSLDIEFLGKLQTYLLPHLELYWKTRAIRLELASPGLCRILRFEHELEFFKGREIEAFCEDGRSLRGILQDIKGDKLVLQKMGIIQNRGLLKQRSRSQILQDEIVLLENLTKVKVRDF